MTKPDSYEPIVWRNGTVRYLDQTLLPRTVSYAETDRSEELIDAMRRLSVRGAPLLGIAGAYAVVLASQQYPENKEAFVRAAADVASARPTAVNLRTAVDRLMGRMGASSSRPGDATSVLLAEALRIHDEVRTADASIGERGAALFSGSVSLLTICNTGPLATGGGGTAFGIIRKLWTRGQLNDVYACETRPLLQGARLTMWEFEQAGIAATLLHDSASGSLMRERRIDAVVVGADRIAANGDTANKVGTYTLAVLAQRHGIPFYVAAPTSTLDPATPTGKEIPIEIRGGEEVRTFGGVSIAPEGGGVFSPAFDVTPADLISAIVTETATWSAPYRFSGDGRIPGTQ